MRILTTLLLLFLLTSAQAQMINRTLDNYKSNEADLVIFALGMEKPLKIGTVDAKGNLSADISALKMPGLSNELKEMYVPELRNVFMFGCDGRDDFGAHGNIPAVRGGNIALWAGNEWAGSFFLVSDPELKPWLEDEGYNPAIKADFLEIIYVEEDVKLKLNCTNEIYLESGNIEVSYMYDLDLKKGFNWVEYSIEDVYVTNPEVRASFPSKVRIGNLRNPESMKWMVNYFF
jgi:hypothetical protein